MRLLCLAAKSNPTGFIAVAGRPCSSTDIARLSGVSEQEVESLLGELSRNGVFSRDAQGRIYSRRMVRDNRKRLKLRQNGAKGGQASFLNSKGIFAPTEQNDEQPHEQAPKPQKPESRVHKPESIPPVGPPPNAAKPKAEVSPLAPDWSLSDDWREIALSRGWSEFSVDRQAVRFKQYFCFGKGSGIRRSEKGWRQSWLNWLDRELRMRPDAATSGQSEPVTPRPDYPPLPEQLLANLKDHYVFKETVIQRWLAPCSFDLDNGIVFAPSGFHADYLQNHYGDAFFRAMGRTFKFVVKPKEKSNG